MPTPLAIVPLKGFHTAKQRLDLPDDRREELARAIARRVVEACHRAGAEAVADGGVALDEQRGGKDQRARKEQGDDPLRIDHVHLAAEGLKVEFLVHEHVCRSCRVEG